MPPHPHDYAARHAHGELDALVVGAAIAGAFRPRTTPVAPVATIRPSRLVVLGRNYCEACDCDHDVYGVWP
jgi:hypothetical protein